MKNEKIKLPEFPSKYKKNLEKKLQEIVGKIIKKFRGEKPDKKPQKKGKANNTSQTESKKDGSSLNIGNTSSSENYPIGSAKSEALPVPKDMVNQADSEDEDYDVLEEKSIELDEKTELLNNFNINYEFNQEISDSFFNFNANLLSNYNQYLNTEFYSTNTMPSLEMLFKVPEYLKNISQADKPFYKKFIEETQIFGDFIYLRMVPKNSKEKIRILKFDEKINEISNNSRSNKYIGVFTNTKEYDFATKSAILRPRPLSEHEINFYKDEKNQKKLLSFGVEVKCEKNEKPG